MRLDTFLQRAAQRPPAAVLQVSYACGLGVLRDLGRHAVPLLALDPDPGAIGLRSRYATGRVCPDPLEDEEAFVTWLETVGPELPQRAVIFPSHDEFIWPLSRHAERLEPWFVMPFSRWDVMAACATSASRSRRRSAQASTRRRPCSSSSSGELEAAAGEIRYPGRAQAGRFAGVQAALPPPRPRRRERGGAAAHLRQGRRPRRADAAGAHPRRRGRALDGRLVPRRRVATAGRVHRPQAAPAPARRRQLPRRREPLGRRARGRPPCGCCASSASTA